MEEEVKPLGNPMSQAVGRRRHHGGSQSGQGQGFPTGVNGHWALQSHPTPG